MPDQSKGEFVATELEELKQRQDALEEVVRQLEHRLTMDEYQLNCLGQMGPPAESTSADDPDGKRPVKRDKWLESVDGMLRSIGLHQGFHANHLKDLERELRNLREKHEHLHEIAMVRTGGPLAAIQEGIERVERMITELGDRRTS
jgi:hypothetical protein